MVVVFSFDAFTRDELLAGRLASNPGVPTSSVVGSLGLSAPSPATDVAFACALAGGSFNPLRGVSSTEGNSLVSSIGRIVYQFVDSDTGCGIEVVMWHFGRILEVVLKTHPVHEGRGISECAIDKTSVCKKESDRPTEEECTPVYRSLVVAAESNA